MAPKGGNAKKESGRAKKAENEAKKQDTAAAEKVRPSDQPLNLLHRIDQPVLIGKKGGRKMGRWSQGE